MNNIGQHRDIRERATEIIRQLYGPEASFREGQYEAIEATMTRNRTLVVQRTGWAKALSISCVRSSCVSSDGA